MSLVRLRLLVAIAVLLGLLTLALLWQADPTHAAPNPLPPRVTYTPIPPTATPAPEPTAPPDAYPYPAPPRHHETLREAVAKLLEDLFGSR